MKFSVIGVPRYNQGGGYGEVTWEDGRLGGDEEIANVVRQEALLLAGERIGPHEGPYTRNRHLAEPTSACIIMVSVFTPDSVRLTGDVPKRPALPPGMKG